MTGDAAREPAPPRPGGTIADTVSRKVRSIRLSRGLSLRAVAAKANVSPSLLSQIERGTASPSLVSLVAIADALAVRPGMLLDDEVSPSASRVVRKAERRVIDDPACRREYLMHVDDRFLEIAELTLPPGGSSRPALAAHSGRDYGIVLRGTATVELASGSEVLDTGDYIAFDSDEPHRLVNESETGLSMIWIIAHDRPNEAKRPSGVE